MQTSNQVSNRRWRGVAAAIGIWSFWVVLPGALLKTADARAFAVAQIGTASLAYLESAPQALCWYLILGQCVMLPALIALAWSLPRPLARATESVQARRQWLSTFLPFLGLWTALYLGGNALMAGIDWHRGAEPGVVRGYAVYLGLYGFLATLPQWGLVFVCRTLIRRSSLSALASVLASAVVAMLGLVLGALHLTWPTPVFLRNQLFSGHADAVAHAEWGFLAWGALLALAALVLSILPTLSRTQGRPKPSDFTLVATANRSSSSPPHA